MDIKTEEGVNAPKKTRCTKKVYSEAERSEINDAIKKFTGLQYCKKNTIKALKKVEKQIRRFAPLEMLKKVHVVVDTSIDLIMYFISLLFSKIIENMKNEFKSMNATILQEIFSHYRPCYKNIIEILKLEVYDQGPIIEKGRKYKIKERSNEYRISDNYISNGITSFEIKTVKGMKVVQNHLFNQFAKLIANPITRNLLNIYPELQFPSLKEIHEEARRIIRLGNKLKNGKYLKYLRKETSFIDDDAYSYVEHSIERYNNLVLNGLMIPKIGGEKAGGRVYDFISLMPSWIRRLIKINGEKIIELDYVCLHPNLIMKIYDGNTTFLTHDTLAKKMNLEIGTVKQEHLSFFNDEVDNMLRYDIFNFYFDNDSDMLSRVIADKEENGYKITSKKLFTEESGLMGRVIERLNKDYNIFVLYIFDALAIQEKDRDRVYTVMNETALELGIFTTVK